MDRSTTRCGMMALCIILLTLGAEGGSAQAKTPSTCQPSDTKPCDAAKSAPSASQQFPFPGESNDTKPVGSSSAPDSKPAKDQFPFPGEKTKAEDPPGESSSSSGATAPSESPTDDKPELKDAGSSGSTRARRRLRPPAQKILSDDERVEEDLSVAHFYQQSGNLNGAYLRAKDAVKIQPQTAEGHLAMAEIAQKMGKRDEAIAEYTRYLELDPDGDGVKAARKSLEKLKE